MKTTPTRFVSLFLPPCSRDAFTGSILSAVFLGAWLLLGSVGFDSRVIAQVPERFSYQGYLEDGNGQPLAPTTPVNYDVVFRIFPSATASTPVLWAERQTVTVDKGNYSVILGQGVQVQPDPHGDLSAVVTGATGSELYVQTTVNVNGSDTTLLPRLRLLPAAYSFLAKKASTADQALNVNGSAIAPGSIQQDRLSTVLASNLLTAPISDTRLSANVALRLGGNTFSGHQTVSIGNVNVVNGNVGVGTPAGTGRLLVNGGVRARGGAPGVAGVNDNGYAFAGNNGDIDSGMFSSADGQVEFYAQGVERMRINGAGNIGIGTANPTALLDVNGTLRANNLTVPGTLSAASITGTFNGDDPSVTYSLNNNNTWRDIQVDGTALLGDADGGRIRMLIRNYNDQSVRIWTWNFYSENDTHNFNRPGGARWGVTRSDGGAEIFFTLGSTSRHNIAFVDSWAWLRNSRDGRVTNSGDGPVLVGADTFKFYFTLPPGIAGSITIFDR